MWGTRIPLLPGRILGGFIPTHVGNTLSRGIISHPCTVHPHACGEHTTRETVRPSMFGSSPRMWGTRSSRRSMNPAPRFIPTHVGNTAGHDSSPPSQPVHPHACGEHTITHWVARRTVGSSPRMWGTPRRARCYRPRRRFIPTHVGNTKDRNFPTRERSVHPHACGEHPGGTGDGAGVPGSSPRMWGTRGRDPRRGAGHRFIPTHVGNTGGGAGADIVIPVHPHACGEHGTSHQLPPSSFGSSPRMWGTPDRLHKNDLHVRFIPTHVGNTFDYFDSFDSDSVHPHACGEHACSRVISACASGSSPRMWGTRAHCSQNTACDRFIPTHVGNTTATRSITPRSAVHPHACGEHSTHWHGPKP